jgi:hypothetical protein
MQCSLPATDTATHPAARQMGATKQQKGNNMSEKTLTIKYTVIEKEDEKDVMIDITGDTAYYDWKSVVENAHDGIIKSLEQRTKDEAKAKEVFVEKIAKIMGESEDEIRKQLDEAKTGKDEEAAALKLILKAIIKKCDLKTEELLKKLKEGKKDE